MFWLFLMPKPRGRTGGEKRILGVSQDLEQFLRKVYSVCKTIMSVSELVT